MTTATATQTALNAAHEALVNAGMEDYLDVREAIDRECERIADLGIEDRYIGLTPSEQAEQVDEDWREEREWAQADLDRRLFWDQDKNWTR